MESLYRTTPECGDPVPGQVQGQVPLWITGSMYRTGPGTFEVGDSEYKHWFDGLGLIHQFDVRDGKVTYRAKYVQSETYKKNMASNRIVISEYGTAAYPDPCKNIFQRMFTWFKTPEKTDNTLVTPTPFCDYVYASSETNVINKIDPKTLDTISPQNIEKYLTVNTTTAHFIRDAEGSLHNIGKSYKGTPKYSFVKIPKPEVGKEFYDKAEVVGSVPFRWSRNPTYLHSFGMSENYYVLVEQVLCLSVLGLMGAKFTGKTYAECLEWHNGERNLFHIIDKKTGKQVNPKIPYVAEPFFMFHHVNTYEEEGHLVVDLCAYEDSKILDIHYLKNLRSEEREIYPDAFGRRYVLPLSFDPKNNVGDNLVTLKDSTASAVKQKNGQILCGHESLSEAALEFPQMNNDFRGKKYRYVYGASGQYIDKIVKIDTVTKQSWVWEDEGMYVSEPVFVPSPGATDEDDGALLVVLYKITAPRHVTSMLILDARTMTELARANFEIPIPRDIHASFMSD